MKLRRRGAYLAKALATVTAGSLMATTPILSGDADAAVRRLHGFQFNACDQFGTSHSDAGCREKTPNQRAVAIYNSLISWDADFVTLQEICKDHL